MGRVNTQCTALAVGRAESDRHHHHRSTWPVALLHLNLSVTGAGALQLSHAVFWSMQPCSSLAHFLQVKVVGLEVSHLYSSVVGALKQCSWQVTLSEPLPLSEIMHFSVVTERWGTLTLDLWHGFLLTACLALTVAEVARGTVVRCEEGVALVLRVMSTHCLPRVPSAYLTATLHQPQFRREPTLAPNASAMSVMLEEVSAVTLRQVSHEGHLEQMSVP